MGSRGGRRGYAKGAGKGKGKWNVPSWGKGKGTKSRKGKAKGTNFHLCAAIAAARPDVKFEVSESVRPYFRYGSGAWGQALYRVNILENDVKVSVFALPSKGAPVLSVSQRFVGVCDGQVSGSRTEGHS